MASTERSLFRALGTISAVLVLTACGSDAAGIDEEAVASVEIAEASILLEVGSSTTLEARVLNASGDPLEGRSVSWSSSRPEVVGVNADGRTEARSTGSAVVRASASGAFDEIEVAVVPAVDPDSPSPTGVRSRVLSDSEVEIVWVDTPGETYFVLEREQLTYAPTAFGVDTLRERSEVARVPAGTDVFVDSDLLPGRTYRHIVRACGDAGCLPAAGADPGAAASTPVMTEGPLEAVTSLMPDGRVGQPFSHPLLAVGGDGDYAWSIAEGSSLPAGLELDADTGLVAGTPAADGDFQTIFVVRSRQEIDTQLVLFYFAAGTG